MSLFSFFYCSVKKMLITVGTEGICLWAVRVVTHNDCYTYTCQTSASYLSNSSINLNTRPADVNSNTRRYVSHEVSFFSSNFLVHTWFSFFWTSIYVAFVSRHGQDWKFPGWVWGQTREYGRLVPRGVKLIKDRVKNGWSYVSTPPYVFMVYTWKKLHLHLQCFSPDKGSKKKV